MCPDFALPLTLLIIYNTDVEALNTGCKPKPDIICKLVPQI